MTGIDYLKMPEMGPLWYVSAMLIGMLILYPLIRKYGKKFVCLVVPIIVVLIYGCIIAKHGKSLSNIYDYEIGFVRCGVLRAISGIGIGSIVFLISGRISKIKLDRPKKVFLTVIEYVCLLLPFFLVAFSKRSYDIFLVPVLALGVCLAFSEQSLLGKYFQNKFIFFLESISLFIYLFHDVAIYWINYLFGSNIGFYFRMGLALIVTLAVAGIVVKMMQWKKLRNNCSDKSV